MCRLEWIFCLCAGWVCERFASEPNPSPYIAGFSTFRDSWLQHGWVIKCHSILLDVIIHHCHNRDGVSSSAIKFGALDEIIISHNYMWQRFLIHTLNAMPAWSIFLYGVCCDTQCQQQNHLIMSFISYPADSMNVRVALQLPYLAVTRVPKKLIGYQNGNSNNGRHAICSITDWSQRTVENSIYINTV